MFLFLDLFCTFFRIGCLTFGGGYTVLPLLQREAVEKKNWITQLEVMDYYAVGQCLPGMIGVNTAILIGYKVKGKSGSVAAALGFAAPSLAIILLIASLIQNVADLPAVQSAFAGIRVAVCALVANAIYTMVKRAIVNKITAILAVSVFIAAVWPQVSPITLVIVAAAAGLILSARDGKLKGGVGAEASVALADAAAPGAAADGSAAARVENGDGETPDKGGQAGDGQ